MIVGGTQTHLLQVFRFLDRRRYLPRLFCLTDHGELLEQVRKLDIPVTTFGMRGGLRHWTDWRGLTRMVTSLRAHRPAVVHGYLLRGNFFAAAAGRMARVPVVITSKRGLHAPMGLAEHAAVRVSNALSSMITGNSPAVLDFTREYERHVPAPMVMIPSGIDTDSFDPARVHDLRRELGLGEAPTFGTAITLRPRKGFRMLFEAYAVLRREFPMLRLLVAGVDRLTGESEDVARELQIGDGLVLLGRRDDMPAVLASCDVFVLPSESEGMSNAVLEAMAMRRPVVVTAVGGNPSVVEESVSGYLVDYPDGQAMAARVARLLNDPALRSRVGQAARDRVVERYSARSMVREMEGLYDRLTGNSMAGHR
jgi:glycosyltransferase involved in cell wall biosynthesis